MEELAKELGILALFCDVTQESDVEAAIKKTMDTFKALHVVLACAGVLWPSMMLTSKTSLDTKAFEAVFRINVFGSAYCAKYGAIAMSKNAPVNGDRGVASKLLFNTLSTIKSINPHHLA